MKKYSVLLLVAIFCLACEKDENTVDAINIEDQEWYKEHAKPCQESDVCKTWINKALYNNDTVYYTSLSGPLCDPIFSVILRNNKGEVVKEYGYEELASYSEEVIFIETIYKCEED